MIQVFEKFVKLQGQGCEVKNYRTEGKALTQGIHTCKNESPISCGLGDIIQVKVFEKEVKLQGQGRKSSH